MGRYLQRAERVMAERVPGPSPAEHPQQPDHITGVELGPEQESYQGELWKERAAIMEVDADLPQALAEAHAAVLCPPLGAHESLEVGNRCLVCNRHLYVVRDGRLWCVRCLRNARAQQATPEVDGEGR
jgi:hypothetical protein